MRLKTRQIYVQLYLWSLDLLRGFPLTGCDQVLFEPTEIMALERPTPADFAARIKIFVQPLRTIYCERRLCVAARARHSTVEVRQLCSLALLDAGGLSTQSHRNASRQLAVLECTPDRAGWRQCRASVAHACNSCALYAWLKRLRLSVHGSSALNRRHGVCVNAVCIGLCARAQTCF